MRIHDAIVDGPLEQPFARWVREALAPPLPLRPGTRRAGESEEAALLRASLLRTMVDYGDDPRARAIADSLAERVAEGAAMDATLADVVVQLAARRGDAARFARYRQLFESSALAIDRQRWLAALGGFDDPALADSALAYTLAGPLRVPEMGTIAFSLSRPEHRDRVWKWTAANFDRIRAELPPRDVSRLTGAAGGCSTERLAEAETLLRPWPRTAGRCGEALDRIGDAVRACTSLRERSRGAVAAYLNGAGATTPAVSGGAR